MVRNLVPGLLPVKSAEEQSRTKPLRLRETSYHISANRAPGIDRGRRVIHLAGAGLVVAIVWRLLKVLRKLSLAVFAEPGLFGYQIAVSGDGEWANLDGHGLRLLARLFGQADTLNGFEGHACPLSALAMAARALHIAS